MSGGDRTHDEPGLAAGGPLDRFREKYLPLYAGAMADCERRLEQIAKAPGAVLGASCAETLAAGGKRLRPLLVFLSSPDGATLNETLSRAAAAVELVHMATLVHDDVLDGAELRRGQPTLVASRGPRVSTSAGDYLFASAFLELAATESDRAVALLADVSLGLSRGELAQMRQAYDYGLDRAAYYERCRLKTSGLFTAACRLGALLSGCSQAVEDAMAAFGDCLGLAFQITDDILDYSGDSASFGKRVGTDLRDGTVTLPLIIALERGAVAPGELSRELSEPLVARVVEKVSRSGALEQSRRAAQGYVDQALEELEHARGEIDTEPLELVAALAADREV